MEKVNCKNIVYVHDLLFIENNGIYSSTGMPEEYFDRFFCAGVDDIIIISRKGGVSDSTEGYSKIISDRIHLAYFCKRNYVQYLSFSFIKGLYQAIKKTDFLVVNFPSITGMLSLLFCIFTKTKYSLEIAADYNQFSSKKFGWIISLIMKPMMSYFSKKSVGNAYVSKFLRDKYPTKNKFIVASNVNLKEVHKKKLLIKSFDENENISIGFVGGLNARKGLDTLIDSIDILVKQGYINLKLHVIGGHQDRDWSLVVSQKGLTKNIVFHGLKNRNFIDSSLKSMDLYVQPSQTEGIPRATLEAMSFSLPVVATQLPGFQEILNHEALVAVGNSEQLANKIKELLVDYDFYNRNIQENSSTAQMFTYHILHKERVSYYCDVFKFLEVDNE